MIMIICPPHYTIAITCSFILNISVRIKRESMTPWPTFPTSVASSNNPICSGALEENQLS